MKTYFVKVAMSIFTSVFAINSMAQDIEVVTLQQGETMKAFYGANAFKEAVETASSGDLITLSGGSFNGTTITKSLIIQGAGYVQDIQNFRYQTSIGETRINIPKEDSGLLIEGISFNYLHVNGDEIKDFTIRRCNIGSIDYNSANTGCIIEQCRISTLYFQKTMTQFFMYNSIVSNLNGSENSKSKVIDHCVIGSISYYVVANFRNSIITNPNPFPSSSTFDNNIFKKNQYSNGSNKDFNTVLEEKDFKALFVNYDSYNYILTDEAAATYLGSDGTQIGIYGGGTPFTDIPSNPRITSKVIAPRSTADGRLSVRITVEAQK